MFPHEGKTLLGGGSEGVHGLVYKHPSSEMLVDGDPDQHKLIFSILSSTVDLFHPDTKNWLFLGPDSSTNGE